MGSHLGTTSPDGAVAMSSANGGYVLGSHLGTGSNPEWVFKSPVCRRKATAPSSLSLTSNRVTTPVWTGFISQYRLQPRVGF